MCDTYEGWKNRETWAVNAHLNRDEKLRSKTQLRVDQALADFRENAAAARRERRPHLDSVTSSQIAGEAIKELCDEMASKAEGSYRAAADLVAMIREVGSVWRVD